jgi:hypothetical protein
MPDLLAVSSARRVRLERAQVWSMPGRKPVMPILTVATPVAAATVLPTKRKRGRLGAHCQEP